MAAQFQAFLTDPYIEQGRTYGCHNIHIHICIYKHILWNYIRCVRQIEYRDLGLESTGLNPRPPLNCLTSYEHQCAGYPCVDPPTAPFLLPTASHPDPLSPPPSPLQPRIPRLVPFRHYRAVPALLTQFVDASMVALLASLTPMCLIVWRTVTGKAVHRLEIIGVLLALAGGVVSTIGEGGGDGGADTGTLHVVFLFFFCFSFEGGQGGRGREKTRQKQTDHSTVVRCGECLVCYSIAPTTHKLYDGRPHKRPRGGMSTSDVLHLLLRLTSSIHKQGTGGGGGFVCVCV